MQEYQLPHVAESVGPYVYIYLDPRKSGKYTYDSISFDHEPFYVGKGKRNRCLAHVKDAEEGSDEDRCTIIRGIYSEGLVPIIVKERDYSTHTEALDREYGLINEIGITRKGTGPLTNIRDSKNFYESLGDEVLIERGKRISKGLRRPEVREKRSKAMTGRKLSEEHSRRISEGKKGKKFTEAHKKALSVAHTGKVVSAETRRKISLGSMGRTSAMKGKKHSDETRAKMSESQRGNPHKVTLMKCSLCDEEVRLNPQVVKAHFKHNHEITDYQTAKSFLANF